MYAIRSYYEQPGGRRGAQRDLLRCDSDDVALVAHNFFSDKVGTLITELERESMRVMRGLFVITSYSIHYTKLYDTAPPARRAGGPRADAVTAGLFVITSYSIHYTKLYETTGIPTRTILLSTPSP